MADLDGTPIGKPGTHARAVEQLRSMRGRELVFQTGVAVVHAAGGYAGQRLVPVNGDYGADGTEYRTTFEEFSRVISSGTAGSGPEKFKVWKKSGEIFEYGYTADSRVEDPLGRGDCGRSDYFGVEAHGRTLIAPIIC